MLPREAFTSSLLPFKSKPEPLLTCLSLNFLFDGDFVALSGASCPPKPDSSDPSILLRLVCLSFSLLFSPPEARTKESPLSAIPVDDGSSACSSSSIFGSSSPNPTLDFRLPAILSEVIFDHLLRLATKEQRQRDSDQVAIYVRSSSPDILARAPESSPGMYIVNPFVHIHTCFYKNYGMHQVNAVAVGTDIKSRDRVEVSVLLLLLVKCPLRLFHSFQAGAGLNSPVGKDVFICVANPLHNPII